jgi:hypothetical protein
MCMVRLSLWFAAPLLFLLTSLILANGMRGQALAEPETQCTLCFSVLPEKQFFVQGEPVILVVSIYNWSAKPAAPVFVSSLKDDKFVDLKVIGPDGKEVPWWGKDRISSREYSPADFSVLATYRQISAKRVISFKDGAGFVFDKPGEYFVTGKYSLGPPEYFVPFAGEAKIPTGTFRSTKAGFCIEACIQGPLRVHRNTLQAPLDAVGVFYNHITRYRPLGIPYPKKVLWPLLSRRLAQEFDSLRACDEDYYRRYGDILKANHYKPVTPWLEEGLFSGSNEAAGPRKFSIIDSRAIGENRVDVHLKFTLKEACCDKLVAQERYEGVVTVILESNRWVIDDFVSLYGNDELFRLSDGYPECKGGQWVGEKPY